MFVADCDLATAEEKVSSCLLWTVIVNNGRDGCPCCAPATAM